MVVDSEFIKCMNGTYVARRLIARIAPLLGVLPAAEATRTSAVVE